MGTDRRFRSVAATLLARRGCEVSVSERIVGVAELAQREAVDVVVLDAGALPTAATLAAVELDALEPPVGVVLVSEDEKATHVENAGAREVGRIRRPVRRDLDREVRPGEGGAPEWNCIAAGSATAVAGAAPGSEPSQPMTDRSSETSDASTEQPPLLAHPLPTALVAIAVAAIAFASYPTGARSALAAFFAAVLVVLSAIDLERRIIPNRIVLPATVIVLIAHIAITPGRTARADPCTACRGSVPVPAEPAQQLGDGNG